MGYRGKVKEQEDARRLRAQNWTLSAISKELGVSKSSVSLWVRDVPFTPSPRRWGPHRRPNPASRRKQAEIEEMNQRGGERLGQLDDGAFLAAGAALYAGEGAKRDGQIIFANSDPAMMQFFAAWLRRFLTSMSRDYAWRCTSIKASTSMQPKSIGPKSRACRAPSF